MREIWGNDDVRFVQEDGCVLLQFKTGGDWRNVEVLRGATAAAILCLALEKQQLEQKLADVSRDLRERVTDLLGTEEKFRHLGLSHDGMSLVRAELERLQDVHFPDTVERQNAAQADEQPEARKGQGEPA